MTTYTCAHCGQTCGDYAGGYGGMWTAETGQLHFCHPNDETRPDCYRRVTVYHEPVGTLRNFETLPAGIEGAANRQAIADELTRLGEELGGD